MSGEDVKTMIGGRITPEGVKTIIKGNVLDIIGAVRTVLDEMSENENCDVMDVALDAMKVTGEEKLEDVSSVHVMITSDTGEIFSKELSSSQIYALSCALGLKKDMQGMSDEEIAKLLEG